MGSEDRPTWDRALILLDTGESEAAQALLEHESDEEPLDAWVQGLLARVLSPGPATAWDPAEPQGSADAANDVALVVGRTLEQALHARRALAEGRVDDLRRHALAAAGHVPTDRLRLRLLVAGLLQAAFRFTGDPEFRDRGSEIATDVANRIDTPHMAILARGILATIHILSGHLYQVESSCRAAIELARATGLADHPIVALAHQFHGYALFEWNRLEEARDELERAWAISGPEKRGVRSGVARMLTAVSVALEEPESADRWFARLEEIVSEPMTLRNREWLAAVRIRHGQREDRDLRLIDRWRQRYDYRDAVLADLGDDRLATRLHEYEHLLGVLEVTRQWNAVLPLADVVLRGAGSHRTWFAVRAMTAKATALEASGRSEEADEVLEGALEAGEVGGFVRVYLDGPPIRLRLLRRAAERIGPDSRAGQALQALPDELAPRGGGSSLTRRQVQVLERVATGSSNRETAEALGIAETTVRTHLRAVFSRLGVGSRTAAVAEGRRLGLL